MNLVNLPEDASPSRDEVYQALVRSLRRRRGFGIVFVQCSPAEAARLMRKIQTDLPQKQFASLKFDAPIDNLYDIVTELPNQESLNILFVEGLEKSLEPYIKPGYGGDGDYYNLDTVPTILSHLNQRRELFRDHFHNICLVFFLPVFAITYIIRRSPDLFDWSAGVFKFIGGERAENLEQEIALTQSSLATAYRDRIKGERAENLEQAIASYIDALTVYTIETFPENWAAIQANLANTYSNRINGSRSENLERAISFYSNALVVYTRDAFPENWAEIQANLANVLVELDRHEEAIASYDKALEIKPDYCYAWNNRGVALVELGRYEEAIASCDKAIKINPDLPEAWDNRGNALRKLGRHEEAITSYNKVVKIRQEILKILQKEVIFALQEHLNFVREIGDHQSEINALWDMGAFYFELGQYRKSYDFIRQSVSFSYESGYLNLNTIKIFLVELCELALIYIKKPLTLFKIFWRLIAQLFSEKMKKKP